MATIYNLNTFRAAKNLRKLHSQTLHLDHVLGQLSSNMDFLEDCIDTLQREASCFDESLKEARHQLHDSLSLNRACRKAHASGRLDALEEMRDKMQRKMARKNNA